MKWFSYTWLQSNAFKSIACWNLPRRQKKKCLTSKHELMCFLNFIRGKENAESIFQIKSFYRTLQLFAKKPWLVVTQYDIATSDFPDNHKVRLCLRIHPWGHIPQHRDCWALRWGQDLLHFPRDFREHPGFNPPAHRAHCHGHPNSHQERHRSKVWSLTQVFSLFSPFLCKTLQCRTHWAKKQRSPRPPW